MIEIANGTATGPFTITTDGISTLGYQNISIIYGVRNTKTFPTPGSRISLAWSVDDGNTWNTLAYQENAANSAWSLINGGTRITLPAGAANQSNLMFQWTGNLGVASSGTYRIDDVQVFGTKN
jgi:hypothetical protein